MTISFEGALELQSRLQAETYGKPLQELEGEARAEAVRTHVLAASDELHEVLRETGWKPWSTKRHFNEAEYKAEMVDLLHFYMNLMLIGGITVDDLLKGYEEKHAVNIERQAAGY